TMRVAYVSYQWGEISLRTTAGLADEDTIQLWLAEDQARPHLRLLDERVDFRPFDKPRLRQGLRQIRLLRELRRELDRFRPDVVHLQHGHLWLNAMLPLLGRYPLVISIHDPRHHLGDRSSQRTPQRVLDFGFRRATILIVHTETMADEVTSTIGRDRSDIHVVPHVRLGEEDDQAEVEEQPGEVLFFGRMWPYKGLRYLIEAQPRINEAVPDARFVVAGRGGDISDYLQQMHEPDKFTVINEYVSTEERARLFRRASVIALPYVEATQSGIVPLAATLGTAVVATRVGGLPDQIDHDRTGLLVPPGDADALADAIVDLLRDPARRQRLVAGARDKAAREWSTAAVAEGHRRAYRAAMERFDPRPAAASGTG
ncbi:MAG: glycosyltransferase family 4 protein, partial [Actinomycetota bacterium]